MQDSDDTGFVDVRWLNNSSVIEIPEGRRILTRVVICVGGVMYKTSRYTMKRIQDSTFDYLYRYGTQCVYTAITSYVIMSIKGRR